MNLKNQAERDHVFIYFSAAQIYTFTAICVTVISMEIFVNPFSVFPNNEIA